MITDSNSYNQLIALIVILLNDEAQNHSTIIIDMIIYVSNYDQLCNRNRPLIPIMITNRSCLL